jgi:predicted transcriptional regulator
VKIKLGETMADPINTETVTFKVDPDTLAGMNEVAKDTGEYRSGLIRRIINEYLLAVGKRWRKDYKKEE